MPSYKFLLVLGLAASVVPPVLAAEPLYRSLHFWCISPSLPHVFKIHLGKSSLRFTTLTQDYRGTPRSVWLSGSLLQQLWSRLALPTLSVARGVRRTYRRAKRPVRLNRVLQPNRVLRLLRIIHPGLLLGGRNALLVSPIASHV
jgi:hypothetical protein